MQTILPVTRIVVLLALLLVASGCGLKGDLYLPETAPEPEQSAPTAETTEDEDDGSPRES